MSGATIQDMVSVVGERVVPVLLHSLWQGGAIALVLWGMLKMAPGGKAQRRYAMSVCALLTVVVCVVGTWAWLGRADSFPGKPVAVTPVGGMGVDGGSLAAVSGVGGGLPRVEGNGVRVTRVDAPDEVAPVWKIRWMDCLAVAWMAGAGLGLGKCLLDLAGAGVLMRQARRVEESAWLVTLEEVRTALGVKTRVRLALSDRVRVPMVAGFFMPMVLIPGFAAPGLTGEELRLILAHELAHVRRHDLWVGLFQAVVEAMLFFNPAVRWISRQVRTERECCCDQTAAKVCPAGPMAYVQMLARWMTEDFANAGRMSAAGGLAMGMTGGWPGGVLERVGRVLFPARNVCRRLPVWAVACGVSVMGVMFAGAGMAAEAVVKAWTPQERVEALAKAQSIPDKPLGMEGSWMEEKTLELMIKPAEGMTIGDEAMVFFNHRGHGISSQRWARNKNGVIEDAIYRSQLTWTVMMDRQTGVSVAGPFNSLGDEKRIRIAMTAGAGRIRTIRVVDEHGAPVADARVMAEVNISGTIRAVGGSWMWKTDSDGVVSFPVDSTKPVVVRVFSQEAIPGTVVLEEGGPQEVRLAVKRGRAVTGRLVWGPAGSQIPGSARFGNPGGPAAGLKVGMLGYSVDGIMPGPVKMMGVGQGISRQWISSHCPYVETDADGRFTIWCLDPGAQCGLFASDSQGWTLAVMKNVKAEVDLGDVVVGGARIAGRLLDPHGLMDGKGKATTLFAAQQGYVLGGTHFMGNMLDLGFKKVKPGEWTFDVSGLVAGKVSVDFIDQTRSQRVKMPVPELKAGDAVLDLVWDLGKEVKPLPGQLPVTVKLSWPEGEPVPTGWVWTNGMFKGNDRLVFTAEDKGEKVVMAPEGMPVTYGADSGLPGFKIAEWKMFTAQADDASRVVTLKLAPAGAVMGKVITAQGKAWPWFGVEVYDVDAQGKRLNRVLLPQVSRADKKEGRFLAGPLVLGKTYLVIVNIQGPTGEKREEELGPYTMTRERPMREAELVVKE